MTSAKQHVSARYTTAKTLADDVAQGSFDTPALLQSLTERLGRPLSRDETSEVEKGITDLVKKLGVAAQEEPQTEFARKMLMAINEIVVPAILRRKGLGFDYNSLRRLWQMSKEFQVAWATSAHPRHDGWLTFATAKIDLSADGDRIEGLRFESSLNRMREDLVVSRGWWKLVKAA